MITENFDVANSFRGNENLKAAGTKTEYTPAQLKEYIKCKLDPIYFITKYIKVVSLDNGVIPLVLYDYQRRMLECYHKNKQVVVNQPRQSGKTTISAAYFVWYIIFNDSKQVAILANKQATADEVMYKIRLSYEHLPHWMQQGVTNWNKRSIELENGSRAFGSATSASGIRGKSINCLYIDEFSHIDNILAEDFFTSIYPTISAGKETKIFVTSTPKGYNHFHKMWHEAELGKNGFVPFRSYWHETPGRDQDWYLAQKAVLGELKANQELDCLWGSSKVKIRNTVTNEIIETSLKMLHQIMQ